jgi:hypothetical protein
MKNTLNLPKNINYNKYNSTSGAATSKWGPSCWDFLFTSIMGRYPFIINHNNKEHLLLKRQFKRLLLNLKNILPCIFCRNSFKIFIKELPIEPYLIGRIQLMYWLYLIKDKVNKKLINQEKQCYKDEKLRLKTQYEKKKISKNEYSILLDNFKKTTFVTIPTPPFKKILDKYENHRAICSKKSLSCILAKKSKK